VNNTPMDEYTTFHFSLANPRADSAYYSVSKLLRRVADHIDDLGNGVTVGNLLLEWGEHIDPETYEIDDRLGPTVTVFYSRGNE
jgi:hypothetical protein